MPNGRDEQGVDESGVAGSPGRRTPRPAAREITQQSRTVSTTTKVGVTMNADLLGLIQLIIGNIVNLGSVTELS
ncbi:hypothetical protein GS506_06770 [Rhodococcus hoagii]|nr:hypothetical protein [Prescottella equi]